MNIGSRSLLFGAHQALIHPWFVALAWWRLYGFPFDLRLWIAFLVHDLGYWGKPNLDGPEGERHVLLGATIMGRLFGWDWHDFALYHSRFYAKKNGEKISKLCVADKYSIVITPAWLYLPLARLSGEIVEYRARGADKSGKYGGRHAETDDLSWYRGIQTYLAAWVEEHRNGAEDTWTPALTKRETL